MADWEQTAPSVSALGDVSVNFFFSLWFEMMKSVCGLSSVESLKGMELNDLSVLWPLRQRLSRFKRQMRGYEMFSGVPLNLWLRRPSANIFHK